MGMKISLVSAGVPEAKADEVVPGPSQSVLFIFLKIITIIVIIVVVIIVIFKYYCC